MYKSNSTIPKHQKIKSTSTNSILELKDFSQLAPITNLDLKGYDGIKTFTRNFVNPKSNLKEITNLILLNLFLKDNPEIKPYETIQRYKRTHQQNQIKQYIKSINTLEFNKNRMNLNIGSTDSLNYDNLEYLIINEALPNTKEYDILFLEDINKINCPHFRDQVSYELLYSQNESLLKKLEKLDFNNLNSYENSISKEFDEISSISEEENDKTEMSNYIQKCLNDENIISKDVQKFFEIMPELMKFKETKKRYEKYLEDLLDQDLIVALLNNKIKKNGIIISTDEIRSKNYKFIIKSNEYFMYQKN